MAALYDAVLGAPFRRNPVSTTAVPVDTRLASNLASAVVDPATSDEAPVVVRIAVLASGSGTNLQALLDDGFAGPRIALVVSDRAEAGALDRARRRGVPAVFLDPDVHAGREAFGRALTEALTERGIGIVVMAGFMRILSPEVVRAYEGRMLNVHPALLPAFPGAHAVADALAWGARVTGVTVHLVDEEVDHGPIVFQEAVQIRDGDDWDSLEARIHEVEHRLLPGAVRALAEGRVRVDGRRVTVVEPASVGEAKR
jgi:phosphoribosylglycinamide formyltransferase-1